MWTPAAIDNVSPLCNASGMSGTRATSSLPIDFHGHLGNKAGTISSCERIRCASAVLDFDEKVSERLITMVPMRPAPKNVSPLCNASGMSGETKTAKAITLATTSLLADSHTAMENVSPLCNASGLSGTQATTRVPAISPGHLNKAANTLATTRLPADFTAARENHLNVPPLCNAYGLSGTGATTMLPAESPGHLGNKAMEK